MEHQLEEQTPEIAERDIYGSFSLADVEFALSVKSIQEVINEPEGYSPMPLAPDYLLGLFNLRGMIIPVIDLKKVFDFPSNDKKERKVAIIEHGEFCVGLLFDSTGEVFNGNEQEKSQFNNRGDDPKESIVQGIFKLNSGKRLIQILDPYGILNLKRLPLTEDLLNTKKRKAGKREQCISFVVGEAACALNINAIQEIVEIKEIKNYALSNDTCLGAVNVRGNTVPIIDLKNLLGYGKTPEFNTGTDNNKMIIMHVNGEPFGLLVQSIESIISYFKEDLTAFPVLGDRKKEMFTGCISTSDEKIQTILLNHEMILSNDEIGSITGGHKKLYAPEETNAIEEASAAMAASQSYIVFSLKDKYALEMSEVQEVIDYPEKLITPPNIAEYFRGIINLRGSLIAIIDPRVLYGMNDSPPPVNPKILIFKSGNANYGFMVDSVDSIATFSDKDKVIVPKALYSGGGQYLAEDIKEAVHLDDEDNNHTLLILSLSMVSSRITNRVTCPPTEVTVEMTI